jgi:hypothetical protein
VHARHHGAQVDGEARHQVITIAPWFMVTVGPVMMMDAPLPFCM